MIFDKPRSKQRIVFVPDVEEESFVHVQYIDKKSGNVTRKHMIVITDVETWATNYKNSGWIRQD